jgi:hypothetical protein
MPHGNKINALSQAGDNSGYCLNCQTKPLPNHPREVSGLTLCAAATGRY